MSPSIVAPAMALESPDRTSIVRHLLIALAALLWLCAPGSAQQPPPAASTQPGQPSPAQTATKPPRRPIAPPGNDPPVYVLMSTTKGDIALELDPAHAPKTVANFLKYADSGFYHGTIFHHVDPKSRIEAGGFTADMQPKPTTEPPVASEWPNGLNNLRGTIAMVRKQGAPDSATSQFLINVLENPTFDMAADGAGHTVFGKVVAGMKVVDDIRFVNVAAKPGGLYTPVEPVVIQSVKRITREQAQQMTEAEKPKRRAPPGPLPPPSTVPRPAEPSPANPQPKPLQPPLASNGQKVYLLILMSTSKGDMVLELDQEHAPITVANFASYVDRHFYEGLIFHRVVRKGGRSMIDVIQGGGYTMDNQLRPTHPPIHNEWQNGLKNLRGTISMARTSDPDSATSQFFINTADNPFLDGTNGGPGYAVFGRVIAGMNVADAIRNAATDAKDKPLEMIVIQTVRRMTLDEAMQKMNAENPATSPAANKPPATSPPATTKPAATQP